MSEEGYFYSWSELYGVEKATTVVTIVGLVGGWTIILLFGQLMMGAVVVAITVLVEFVLFGIAKKRRDADE